jgi:hypothetical protein
MERDDDEETPPSTSPSGTGLRGHWLVLIGVGLAVTIAVIAIGELSRPDEPVYHAEALVVANELAIRVESLPRTAVAIFDSSSVAELAATLSGTEIDPDYLIREIVSAEPVENTNVIKVDAIHTDPELAALYANAAAEALAQELNRIGAGLGSFSLHVRAEVPDTPIPAGRLQLILAALIAGAACAMGAAALYLRRSGVGTNQDEQDQPTESHPPVDETSTDEDSRLVRMTILEGDEEIERSANDPRSATTQQQLTNVNETPDDGRARWFAALEDIRSPKETQPPESLQDPSGTVEQGGSSVAAGEVASDDIAPSKGGVRHPQMPRRTGSGAPDHEIRRPSGVVIRPGSVDPPAP